VSSGPVRLVLLRHGQSEWNAAGIFTVWENAHLTAHGELEAARAGALLAEHGVLPAFVHTSLQRRTIRTADLALAAADRDWIPVRRSWRLNGRHYGALQGRPKAEAIREYGERQVRLWRRSYDATPPPAAAEAWRPVPDDPRYVALPPEARPRAESLRDVFARLLPYWYDAIVPDLREGKTVLVAAHGNSLRAMVKHLDGISDDDIPGLNIPTGIPLRYDLDDALRPTQRGGTYLDPAAAKEAIEAVKNQGR
jgi:2,3-bisphosphoglycerate-dependent phosphoglycerate mutase